jgi:hypothetical protein
MAEATRRLGKKNQRHREMVLVAKRSKAWGCPGVRDYRYTAVVWTKFVPGFLGPATGRWA